MSGDVEVREFSGYEPAFYYARVMDQEVVGRVGNSIYRFGPDGRAQRIRFSTNDESQEAST